MNQFQSRSSSILLLFAASVCLCNGQFLPQSHLGRLVQSITSPLVISTSSYRAEQESGEPASSYHPDSSAASYYPSHHHGLSPMDGPPHMAQHHPLQPQPQMERPDGLRLQQAPSQQRGVPQQYFPDQHQQPRHHAHMQQQQQQMLEYQQQQQQQQQNPQMNSNMDGGNFNNQEDSDIDDQGTAPSNHRQRNNEQQQQQNQMNNGPADYQMGAYLGPTIDDKEINGAFNSNNDDDEPAGFDGPTNSQGSRNKAASSAYGNHEDPSSANAGGYHGQSSSAVDEGEQSTGFGQVPRPLQGGEGSNAGYQGAGYDEDGVDEDESPIAQRPRGGRSRSVGGLSGAASQYRQQGGYGSGGSSSAVDNGSDELQQQQPAGGYGKHQSATNMMAAANGYAPFGYANGPVDLTGLMAGGAGGDGFALYGGAAGAYPGANPYGQPQGGQRGGRNQAASNYNGLYGNGQRANNDNDDQDNDGDDD